MTSVCSRCRLSSHDAVMLGGRAVERRRFAVGTAHDPAFRGEHDLRPAIVNGAADEPFVFAETVNGGGIQKRHAKLERTMNGANRLGLVARAVTLGHPHAPEADRRNIQSALPELTQRHSLHSVRSRPNSGSSQARGPCQNRAARRHDEKFAKGSHAPRDCSRLRRSRRGRARRTAASAAFPLSRGARSGAGRPRRPAVRREERHTPHEPDRPRPGRSHHGRRAGRRDSARRTGAGSQRRNRASRHDRRARPQRRPGRGAGCQDDRDGPERATRSGRGVHDDHRHGFARRVRHRRSPRCDREGRNPRSAHAGGRAIVEPARERGVSEPDRRSVLRVHRGQEHQRPVAGPRRGARSQAARRGLGEDLHHPGFRRRHARRVPP